MRRVGEARGRGPGTRGPVGGVGEAEEGDRGPGDRVRRFTAYLGKLLYLWN